MGVKYSIFNGIKRQFKLNPDVSKSVGWLKQVFGDGGKSPSFSKHLKSPMAYQKL